MKIKQNRNCHRIKPTQPNLMILVSFFKKKDVLSDESKTITFFFIAKSEIHHSNVLRHSVLWVKFVILYLMPYTIFSWNPRKDKTTKTNTLHALWQADSLQRWMSMLSSKRELECNVIWLLLRPLCLLFISECAKGSKGGPPHAVYMYDDLAQCHVHTWMFFTYMYIHACRYEWGACLK